MASSKRCAEALALQRRDLTIADNRDLFPIPLQRGREFTGRDEYNATFVAIISEALARETFPNEDPLGKGWFLKIKVKDASEFGALMSEAEYQDYLKTLS